MLTRNMRKAGVTKDNQNINNNVNDKKQFRKIKGPKGLKNDNGNSTLINPNIQNNQKSLITTKEDKHVLERKPYDNIFSKNNVVQNQKNFKVGNPIVDNKINIQNKAKKIVKNNDKVQVDKPLGHALQKEQKNEVLVNPNKEYRKVDPIMEKMASVKKNISLENNLANPEQEQKKQEFIQKSIRAQSYIQNAVKNENNKDDYVNFKNGLSVNPDLQKPQTNSGIATTNASGAEKIPQIKVPEIVPFEKEVMEHLKGTEVALMLPSKAYQRKTLIVHDVVFTGLDSFSKKCVKQMLYICKCEKFQDKTILLAVYIYRKFEFKIIDEMQLVKLMITSILVAMKMEEIYPPDLNDIIEYAQRSMKGYVIISKSILQLERSLFVESNFVFKTPFLLDWIHYYCFRDPNKNLVEIESRNILQKLYRYPNQFETVSSQIASSIIYIARSRLNLKEIWTHRLISVSGYETEIVHKFGVQYQNKLNEIEFEDNRQTQKMVKDC